MPNRGPIMTKHDEAMAFAAKAEVLSLQVASLYAQAAEKDAEALALVDHKKAPETYGIIAVSTCACWFKARNWDKVREVVAATLNNCNEWGQERLREMAVAVAREEREQQIRDGELDENGNPLPETEEDD